MIRWNEDRREWLVFLLGEFARYVTAFESLVEAQRYVDEMEAR